MAGTLPLFEQLHLDRIRLSQPLRGAMIQQHCDHPLAGRIEQDVQREMQSHRAPEPFAVMSIDQSPSG
jgi:hypothetical protein